MNVRIADVQIRILTGYPPSVSATPAGLVDRCRIHCSQKYEFCKCSLPSLLTGPGSHEAPECSFVVPSC